MVSSDNWYCWLNGKVMAERDALIPFRDRGFKYGDAVFDTTRTFSHRIFKLKEHIERLYKSLAYLRIEPDLTPAALMAASEEVANLNLKSVPEDEDIWITQRVSRGIDERDLWPDYPACTVIIECRPLPFRERARNYRDGLDVITATVRRTPPEAISPRAKTNNYLNFVIAELEVKDRNPDAHALLLDTNGNLAEGRGSNIFLVKDGVVYTPREQFVLPGISRQTVIDLAREMKLDVVEKDLDLYDAFTADEAFITSTSWCACPVGTINGARIGNGTIPGPVTKSLMDAYVKYVDCDWVGQYLRFLNLK